MSYIVTNDDSLIVNENEEITRILQSVRCVLLTRKGTVPMYRNYGLSREYLDSPTTVIEPLVAQDVKESVEDVVSGVTVTDVSVTKSDTGSISIKVKVEMGEEDE